MHPTPGDPDTAREQARASAATGATNVFLVDTTGALHRMVRLPKAPPDGWTRQLLHDAIAARSDTLPPLGCETYAPTVAIQDHIRVGRTPPCTAP